MTQGEFNERVVEVRRVRRHLVFGSHDCLDLKGEPNGRNRKPHRMEESDKMAKIIYVTCMVSTGLFESEFYVTVGDSAIYVDRDKVKVDPLPHNGDKVKGQVIAYFIEEKSDRVLVELPGEPVIGGLRAWVPKGGRF